MEEGREEIYRKIGDKGRREGRKGGWGRNRKASIAATRVH